MDFEFSEDQNAVRKELARYLERKAPIDKQRELFGDEVGIDLGVWRGLANLGCFGMLLSEDDGGGSITSQPLIDLYVVAEEFGRTLQPGPFIPTNVGAFAIGAFGSDKQRAEVLPGIISGDTVLTWCLVEDDVWQESGVQMQAVVAGDDFVLDGTKAVVEAAVAADAFIVTARVQNELTQFLVPSNAVGVTTTPRRSLDLTRRFGTVTFDGVRVPGDSVIGVVGGAQRAVEEQLRIAILLLCAESVAAMDTMLARTVEYCSQREQFGRRIGSFQAIKHRLADLHMLALSSRAVSHYAALSVQENWPDADEAVAIAKAHVGEAFVRSAHEMIQLHGGIGFTWEHDAHLYLKRAKTNELLYGDPRWHRERLFQLVEKRAV